MELQIIALLAFALITLTTTALALVVRDVLAIAERRGGRRATVVLRPAPIEFRQTAQGPIRQLDHFFHRLCADSGMQVSPWTLVLLLTASGAAAGGAMFILTEAIPFSAAAAVGGLLLPLPVLVLKRSRRLARMQRQLPDVLDLLARAVHAGESLDQAIALVGQRSAEPLASEFRRAAQQLEMGLSVPAAIRSLAQRVPLTDMKIFGATVAVHRVAGGHLAHTLERLAAVVRERLSYRRQVRATTAAGRFSATLVAATGPLLFVYLMFFQPEYFNKLLTIPLGQMLLAIAVVLEIVGLAWVVQLLKQPD